MKVQCKTFDPNSNKLFQYAQLKFDGHFIRVQRDARNGELLVWSSHPHDITAQVLSVPQFKSAFSGLPTGASLLGELWIPSHPRSEVKTALIGKSNLLQFSAFAIATWPADRDCSDWRLESVQQQVERMNLHFIQFQRITDLEHQRKIASNFALVDYQCTGDIEGIVFKNANVKDWYKHKPRPTIDLIITGYTPGAGKYSGIIGSIHCATKEGYAVCDCSGMTDTERRGISEKSDELIGKVIEVAYQMVGANGRLVHPVFVALRDDKTAEGCGVAQDVTLMRYWAQRESLFNSQEQ